MIYVYYGVYLLAAAISAAIGLKIFLKLRIKYNDSYTCLVGKTAIVTGANTGIGYVTALDFAKRGARVILACRNKYRAEEARLKIVKATNNTNVVCKIIHMTSLKSVREFAKDFNESEERLDILVNNAGAGGLGNNVSDDGIQLTLQVNHISGFLLTHLLLDKMKKSGGARIINVSSIAAKFAKFDATDLNKFPSIGFPPLDDTIMYGNSKLCNIYFTTELAKKLDKTGITVNALHPGAVSTDIFRRMPIWIKALMEAGPQLFFKTPEEGAQTTIYLSVSKDVEGVSGKLFDNCKQIEMYSSANNQDMAKKLWPMFEDLAQLSEEEKIT